MEIHRISRKRYLSTVLWAVIACLVIVGSAAGLGRAAKNFHAALTEKPDIAIYMLLPDEGISSVELLRESEDERNYLAETTEGPKYIKLKKGSREWFVSEIQSLHPTEEPEEETQSSL